MQEKKKLIELGAELYQLGLEIETARNRLRTLVETGAPYDSDEVTSAALQLQFLQAQWTEKETAYFQLRESVAPASDNTNFLC